MPTDPVALLELQALAWAAEGPESADCRFDITSSLCCSNLLKLLEDILRIALAVPHPG